LRGRECASTPQRIRKVTAGCSARDRRRARDGRHPAFPRGEWSPLPYDGCARVEGKVLIREDDFFVAKLRFAPEGTIHEHAGPNDTIVVCLEGEGLTSVASETSPLRAGQQARWPKDVPHRLWTEGTTMVTLMVEGTPGRA
jgi:quercetin dioxygenase-like cupin family protein